MTRRLQPHRALKYLPVVALIAGSALPGRVSAQDSAEESGDIVTLSTFTIVVDRESGYRATNTIGGTRSNTPIKDIPLNIHVFTKDLAADLNITNQIDLEEYNASLVNGGADIRSENPIQQQFNQFLFRGFVQNWGMRDGIRQYDPIDYQGIERTEVVKGPSAALYGLAYPGGVMNNITKEVNFNRSFTSLRFQAGDNGRLRGTIDANYITETANGGEIGIRFNGAKSRTKDERAHSTGDINFGQLQLAWRPDDGTELKFLAELAYRGKPNGLGYFTVGEEDADGNPLGNGASVPLQIIHPEIPWTWNWADGKNKRSLDTSLFRGTITKRITEDFIVTGYYQYSDRTQIDGNGWDANGSGGADSWEAGGGWIREPGNERIEKGYSYRDWSNSMHSYGATGVYKLNFENVKNTFTFGAAVWQEKFVSRSYTQAGADNPERLVYPVRADIFIESPFSPPSDLHPVNTGNGFTHENNSNDYYFVNWQGSFLNDKLKTNVGLNRANIKLIQWANGNSTEPDNVTEQSETSPLYGLVYDINDQVSIFAVSAKSLFPNSNKNSFGEQMPVIVGESIEGGFKFNSFGGKLSGTVSYYVIEQTGGSQFDPNAENLNTSRWDSMTPEERAVAFPGQTRDELLGDQVPGGKAESKGLEIDLHLQATRSWILTASYAYNDQKTTEAINPDIIGQSNAGHIKNRFALVTRYTILEGDWSGAFFGAGFTYSDKALQDYTFGFARYNPSYTTAQLFGGYRFKLFDYDAMVQVNIDNLTRRPELVGWKATGSADVIATERYEVDTPIRYAVTFGIDF